MIFLRAGITMLTLTPAIIMELQSRHPGFPPIRGGIFVHRVMEGSPSEQAGRFWRGTTYLPTSLCVYSFVQTSSTGWSVIRIVSWFPSTGLIAGDIILGINGKEIRSTNEVYDMVNREPKLNMTILRNQKVEYVNVYPEEIQVHWTAKMVAHKSSVTD